MPRPKRTALGARNQPNAATSLATALAPPASSATLSENEASPSSAPATKRSTRSRNTRSATLDVSSSDKARPHRQRTRDDILEEEDSEEEQEKQPVETQVPDSQVPSTRKTRSAQRSPSPVRDSQIVRETPPPGEEEEEETPRARIVTTPESRSPTPASSNAENHEPHRRSTPSIPSSPPPVPRTPSRRLREGTTMIFRDFSSDAGYTPPPPSRHKRTLGELEPRTLEPVPGENELLPVGTPTRTPRRMPVPAMPVARVHTFYIGDDDEEFYIYSDPKSPSSSPGKKKPDQDQDPSEVSATYAPPMSVSPSPSPTPRKRGSDEMQLETSPVAEKKARRGPARGKQAKKEKEEVTTEMLKSLLPKRRKKARPDEDELMLSSESEAEPESDEDDTDELSRPHKRSRRVHTKTSTRKSIGRTYGKQRTDPSAKKTRRKAKGKAVETDVGVESEDTGLGDEDRGKLKQIAEKFKEVDQWELAFEDVETGSLQDSQRSSEVGKR